MVQSQDAKGDENLWYIYISFQGLGFFVNFSGGKFFSRAA